MTNTTTHAPNISNKKIDPSQTIGLHSKIHVKINMLIELWASNYATHDCLFNRVDKAFQYVFKLHDNESFIWIVFNNAKAGSTTRIQNQHLYINNISKHWTLI
jgi:hypothetical protein